MPANLIISTDENFSSEGPGQEGLKDKAAIRTTPYFAFFPGSELAANFRPDAETVLDRYRIDAVECDLLKRWEICELLQPRR
jgi:hypothetical protein